MWQIRCSSPAICSHRVSCRETFCIWFFSFPVGCRRAHPWSMDDVYSLRLWCVRGIFFEYMHWDTVIILEFQLYFIPDIIAAVLYIGVITGGWLRGVVEAGMNELKCIFHAAAEWRVSCCWVVKRCCGDPCNYLPIIAHMLAYNWASPPVISEGWIGDSEWQPVIILHCLYVLRNRKVTQQKHSFCLCRVW